MDYTFISLLLSCVNIAITTSLVILYIRGKKGKRKPQATRVPVEKKRVQKIPQKKSVKEDVKEMISEIAIALEEKYGVSAIDLVEKIGELKEKGILDIIDIKILYYYYVEGHSQYRISKILGMSHSSVNRRVKKLRKLLAASPNKPVPIKT